MRTLKAKLEDAEAACAKAEKQLQDLNDQATEVESQVEASAEEIRALEDELDEIESRNVELSSKLDAAHKALDENGQAKKTLENRGKQDGEKRDKLEGELGVSQDKVATLSTRYEELQAEIEEYEDSLDEQDERLENAEEEVKALEEQMTQISNTLWSLEANDKTTNDKNAVKEIEIAEWQDKLISKEQDALQWEAREEELNAEQDSYDTALAEAREKHEQTKNEFDSIVAEISEM